MQSPKSLAGNETNGRIWPQMIFFSKFAIFDQNVGFGPFLAKNYKISRCERVLFPVNFSICNISCQPDRLFFFLKYPDGKVG